MPKRSHKEFVDAVKAKGVKYFPNGGLVSNTIASPGQATAPGGGSLLQTPASWFTQQNQYQAQLAPTTQTNYSPVINAGAQQAMMNPQQVQENIARERALEGQLALNAAGQGPNPAQMQLNQATGQNVAAQAALMAGQRGAGANAGLIARQAAMQGAGTQQQAVGQAATLGAQQQLAAQQQQAALQGQVGQQISAQGATANQLFGMGAGAQNAQNANLTQNYNMMQGYNAQIASQNAQALGKTESGMISGASDLAGKAAGFLGLAGGGQVPQAAPSAPSPGPQSFAGRFLMGMADGGEVSEVHVATLPSTIIPPSDKKDDKKSSPTPAIAGDSGGEGFIAGGADSAAELAPYAAMAAKGGDVVPGKASVSGDSLKNDKVPAMLSPGEIIIPRSIAQHPDAVKKAAAFVQAIVAKQGLKRKK